MTSSPRAVFDTNVLISAALSRQGNPRRALVWVARNGAVLASSSTLHEFITRIRRPKFDRYVDSEEREAYIGWLLLRAELVEIRAHVEECRDPDDDKFLELAISGDTDVMISGDNDLLALNPFRGIPIMKPNAFLESDFM